MADFTLEEIIKAAGCTVRRKNAVVFSGVVTDTRRVSPGSLFVALKGEKFDGHDFLAQAVAQGAAGVVVGKACSEEKLREINATVVCVEDTLAAYQGIAAYHRGRFSVPVIAVTGSNGKTTTKDLLAAVLGGKWKVLKTKANYNNEIGLPLTLLELDESHEAAVVEMGMRGLGQIQRLAEIARPDIGVVTNVGETHIELLGSLENIARAKGELVDKIPTSGAVILNEDNPYVKVMAASAQSQVVTFGLTKRADVFARDISGIDGRTRFNCVWRGGSFPVCLPMPGRHNVYNALAALAAGLFLGMNVDEIQRGLRDLEVTGMRLEVKRQKDYIVINDAYNASPASMRAAIETLADIAGGRKIAVVGDMLELGDISVEAHEAVGKELAEKQVDIVVTLGKMGSLVAASAKHHGCGAVFVCETHEEAATRLKEVLLPDDTILFKGSRGMQMEKVMEFI